MNLDELYRVYGELVMSIKVNQAKLNDVERRIVEELNKLSAPVPPVPVSE